MSEGKDPNRFEGNAEPQVRWQESSAWARDQIAETRQRITDLERRFGIASADVPGAIGRGEMEETLEVCDWMIDFDFLRRVNARASPD